MTYTYRLNDIQWEKLYEYLQTFRGIHTRDEEGVRRFVEAVLWVLRSGAQWRLLPPEYGNWNVVYQRFADWSDRGIWHNMLYYLDKDPDMEYVMVDSAICRAHACAAGAPKKTEIKH